MSTRSLEILVTLAAAAALAACGGGGGDASTPPPAAVAPPAPSPSPAPVAGAAIAGLKLAQSLLFPSDDSALVLVAGKQAYVQVDVTAPAGSPVPAGVLHVQDASGATVRDIALVAPTDGIPASVPARPGPGSSYHALVPASLVVPGLRLRATLANGASAIIDPRVGGGVTIRLVQVPLRVAGSTGVVVSGAAPYVLARMPLAGVTPASHAAYTSTQVTAPPATDAAWSDAFSTLLGELADLQTLEGAASTDYYAGFAPKQTSGIVGLGYRPGHAVVVADWIGYDAQVRGFLLHELGHNLGLRHAPCGVTDADPAYPYADGTLGDAARYIWGYLPATSEWIDPTDASKHDVMGYCDGTTFSDYSWRLMQVHLTPADKATAAQARAGTDVAPQELVLVSGEIRGGRATLRPFKTLRGRPTPVGGPYTLRLGTAAGPLDVPFAARELDHDAGRLHFGVAVPDPGTILDATILADGAVLAHVDAPVHADRLARAQAARGPGAAPVQANERDGRLQLAWDAGRWPYLSVTWAGAGRQVLAQDLRGGHAWLPLADLPAGGAFEFSLSDGLGTLRLEQPR